MWKDPIVESVRRARHKYAKKFNNNPRLIFEDLKRLEKQFKEAQKNKTTSRARARKKQAA